MGSCASASAPSAGTAARDRGGDHRAPADRSGGRILLAGEDGERGDVEARRALARLEPERSAQTGLVEQLIGTLVHRPASASAVRRSARPRSSCTPTVDAGRPITAAISSTDSSLK